MHDDLDHTIKKLYEYLPPLTKRDDFDQFWESTFAQSDSVPPDESFKPHEWPSDLATVYDVTYNGFDYTRIHAWLIVPTVASTAPVPCVIRYHGKTGNRGTPSDHMRWPMMGVAVLAADVRGQTGLTGDNTAYLSGFRHLMYSRGILDKNEYYWRAVYMDSIRAIDVACSREEIDSSRIIIDGGSQGGGIAMGVAALDERPWFTLADVPSNSNIDQRILGRNGGFSEVAEYLRRYPQHTDQAFETVSYFDTMNMADKITCPVYASVGLLDPVCPAKHFFATYNRITSPKEIEIYPFNEHDGGGAHHNEKKVACVGRQLRKVRQ